MCTLSPWEVVLLPTFTKTSFLVPIQYSIIGNLFSVDSGSLYQTGMYRFFFTHGWFWFALWGVKLTVPRRYYRSQNFSEGGGHSSICYTSCIAETGSDDLHTMHQYPLVCHLGWQPRTVASFFQITPAVRLLCVRYAGTSYIQQNRNRVFLQGAYNLVVKRSINLR